MYSLYRAWLSLGPCPVVVPPPTSSATHHQPLNLSNSSSMTSGAPDVSLQVGPGLTHFSAHRSVLSTHSGFFKAALNHSENGPIAVPNVNVDEFSALLTFMYTGFLDLNLGNIYNILLATHILHMPRALEICRSFLLQSQPISHHHHHSHPLEFPSSSSSSSQTIIKPIPNKKPAGGGTAHHQQIFAPSSFTHFAKSDSTPFKIVNKSHNKTEEKPPPIVVVEQKQEEEDVQPPGAVIAIPLAPPPPPQLPERKTRNKNKKTQASSSSSLTIPCTSTSTDQPPEKVIIDIACCDGPIRFHRVINKNYGNNNTNETTSPTSSSNLYEIQEEINRSAALNKAMSESIQQQLNTTSESLLQQQQNNNETFTCFYCNHTFKSQYCYQKHARRHLNPVSLDGKNPSTSSSGTLSSSVVVQSPVKESKRSPVKLLDMNVQYYPCKTCGSKFPSYYFVHKHRKLCHADEMADNTNKNNEMLPENSNNNNNEITSDSESSAQIDVEGVNNDE